MTHNKLTQNSVAQFAGELEDLVKKHGFAGLTALLVSNNVGCTLKITNGQIILGTDFQRLEAAHKMLENVSANFTGKR